MDQESEKKNSGEDATNGDQLPALHDEPCSVPVLEGPDRFGNYRWRHPNGSSENATPRDAVLIAILRELQTPAKMRDALEYIAHADLTGRHAADVAREALYAQND